MPLRNQRRRQLPPLDPGGQPYRSLLADKAVALPGVLVNRRTWQLAAILLGFCLRVLLEKLFPGGRRSEAEFRRSKAVALRNLLIELGPTFIKMGQFLSARRDLIPQEIHQELSCLQDRVPPFSMDSVRQIVISNLGGPPESIFADFEHTPLASASIGQVHKVRLIDKSEAVVKVQRPGLVQYFYRDLGYLRLWARFLLSFGNESARFWLDLSDQFGRCLFEEIDYLAEGRNADRLRHQVRPNPRIRIPRVHWHYTGRQILTLEYLPGTKIDNLSSLTAQRVDIRSLVNLLIECYLEQSLRHGFFHADPHAGNLAVTDEAALVIYDFGMMGEITDTQARALSGCLASLYDRDARRLVANLIELGMIERQANLEPIIKALTPLIDYCAGADLMEVDLEPLASDLDRLLGDHSFQLPPTLAYLIKTAFALDGIARTLQPNFSLARAIKPVLRKWAFNAIFTSAYSAGPGVILLEHPVLPKALKI